MNDEWWRYNLRFSVEILNLDCNKSLLILKKPHKNTFLLYFILKETLSGRSIFSIYEYIYSFNTNIRRFFNLSTHQPTKYELQWTGSFKASRREISFVGLVLWCAVNPFIQLDDIKRCGYRERERPALFDTETVPGLSHRKQTTVHKAPTNWEHTWTMLTKRR